MNTKSSSKITKRLSPVLLGLIIIILSTLGMSIGYTVRQQNKAALKLTPEDAIQAFREAGFTIEDLRDINYYSGPLHPGIYGRELNLIVGGDTYQTLVILYSNQLEARKATREVNGLDRSMNGGYASAFGYGAILVQIYPSDEPLTNRLHSILKEID